MNIRFQNSDQRTQQNIQSFHEPALRVLEELYERNRANLCKKGYDENNAAITREGLSQQIARRFRIAMYLAQQVVNSLVRVDAVESFGGYVKPKAVTE